MLQGFERTAVFRRRYRVDATILLFGVPLLTRRNVGGGYAAAEIGRRGPQSATALQFAAGSWAEQAHGLNRFGALHEVLIESPDGSRELGFAGLITPSNEQSLDQGRQALRSGHAARVVLTRGTSRQGCISTWTEPFAIERERTWLAADGLLASLLVREPTVAPRETTSDRVCTFLLSLRDAALSREALSNRTFLHEGSLYSLQLRRRKVGQVEGVVRNPLRVKTSEFLLEFAQNDTSGLPLRIEYRAKSFLKLIFESVPDSGPPAIPSLFAEETI